MAANVLDYAQLSTLLVKSGYPLTLFKEDEVNLETAFMELTKGITA
jgi:ABC-2 type transport system ATP-binding protein